MPLILGRTTAASRDFGFARRVSRSPGELITYSGDGHLITVAPTGTGKTSGPVICNALTHPGQLIVLDMKGEVHAATAQARRSMGQEVHVLDLRDEGQPGSLNPLDLAMRCGTEPAAIARSFAAEIIERTGNEHDRFWNDWAETIIAGGVAWLLEDCQTEERRLSALFDLFNAEDPPYTIACLLDKPDKVKNRSAKTAFSGFLQLPDTNTRPSVLGTVQTHLRLFDTDLTRRLTDTTSFDLDAFIAGKPMSLYLIVPPFRLTAYAPLLRMWISGLILAITRRQRPPEHRTLMLVDEIGNLGRLDAFLTAATLMRSWGLTLWSFWQNIAQLQIYGSQANTIVDNAGVVQVFGARNQRMAQDLANIIGGVTADEIMKMPKDEQLLLIEGQLTRAKQARYYSDALFGPVKS
jgi:type IV secretion system protein VirD4